MSHPESLGGGRFDFARWTAETSFQAAERTLDRLRELQVLRDTPGRLANARDLIRRSITFPIQYDHPSSATGAAVGEALKTIFEQYLIVKHLHTVDRDVIKKLKLMQKGGPLPAEQGDDPGRDAQAELFAGVVLRGAGYFIDLGEPDLRISKDRKIWGVAVKRVKSDKRFRQRVRHAQRQLVRQDLYGFIVVNPELMLYRLHAEGLDQDSISQFLYDKTGEWSSHLDDSDPNNRVLAVMAIATAFRLTMVKSQPQFRFGVFTHVRYVTSGTAREIAAVKQIGDDMHRSINQSFTADMRDPVA